MAHTKRETLEERFKRMSQVESELRQRGYQFPAGIDEAGRGPLAGPVFAAAVILDPERPIVGLNDSKKLSEKKRLELEPLIKKNAIAWAICMRDENRIDEINILQATKEAMTEAVLGLQPAADLLLLDAVILPAFPKEIQMAYNQGDAKVNAIAAASILAKTARDRYITEMDDLYPQYGFAAHKGYGTKQHYEALDTYGPCPIHRLSFLNSWYAKRSE